MDHQNEVSASEKIMSDIEYLPEKEKRLVLNKIKNKYFSEHNGQQIKENESKYDAVSSSRFSEFLGRKKAQYEEEQINWNRIKKDWIEQLKGFMKQIDEWLEAQKKAGTISIREMNFSLQEEHLGEYKAPSRELSISNEKIQIKPIGRLIIGAKGRIDIRSSFEGYILLYLEEQGWVYRKETDTGKFHAFTREKFEGILEDLL